MIIKDGATGTTAAVNEENRLDVEANSRPIEQHINEFYGKCFSLPFDAIDPAGADDYFLHIKNTGTKDLHVVNIEVRSTVAGTVEVHAVSGTASYAGATDVTPVNRKIGDTGSITATIKHDTNTTGLTNGFDRRRMIALFFK